MRSLMSRLGLCSSDYWGDGKFIHTYLRSWELGCVQGNMVLLSIKMYQKIVESR